jgi:hypothetical protein
VIKEPKRLVEGQGALAESLAATQLRLPSDARMAALAARLATSGALLTEPGTTPLAPHVRRPAIALKAPLEWPMKVAISGVILGALAIAGAISYRHASRAGVNAVSGESRPASALTIAPVPPVNPAQTAAPALPTQGGIATGAEASAPSAARSRPIGGDSAPEATTNIAAAAPSQAPQAARAVPESSEARAPAHNTEPSTKRNALAPPTRSEGGTAQGHLPSLPANTVIDSEVEMLKKARSALGTDSLEAFALSERCRAQYPNGAFTQEREFIAISALVRLGRRDEARSRASLFRTHYRNSAYLPQLTRMLGEE